MCNREVGGKEGKCVNLLVIMFALTDKASVYTSVVEIIRGAMKLSSDGILLDLRIFHTMFLANRNQLNFGIFARTASSIILVEEKSITTKPNRQYQLEIHHADSINTASLSSSTQKHE